MFKQKFLSISAIVSFVALAFLTSPAFAVPIGIGSFSGTDVLIDFDGLNGGGPGVTNGDIVTNQFAASGVIFANSFGNSHADDGLGTAADTNSAPNVLWSDQGGGITGGFQFVDLLFSGPVSRVGMGFFLGFSDAFRLEIFGAGNTLLETHTFFGTMQSSFDEGFAGVSSLINIEFARISSRSSSLLSQNFSIDDLRFDARSTVPEPTTLALLGLGLAGLGFKRRQNK